jgi:hypothetical protein
VHQQEFYLIAMRSEFKKRLKESSVYLLGFVGEIEMVRGNIRIKNKV